MAYLINKLGKEMDKTGISEIGIAGGVADNSELRRSMSTLATKRYGKAYIPKFEYCTDNAAMIAFAGEIKLQKEEYGTLTDVCYTRKK